MKRQELCNAARNVAQLAKDVGDDYNGRHRGWKAYAARELGLTAEMIDLLVHGQVERLSEPTVRRISKVSGVPVPVLMAR